MLALHFLRRVAGLGVSIAHSTLGTVPSERSEYVSSATAEHAHCRALGTPRPAARLKMTVARIDYLERGRSAPRHSALAQHGFLERSTLFLERICSEREGIEVGFEEIDV